MYVNCIKDDDDDSLLLLLLSLLLLLLLGIYVIPSAKSILFVIHFCFVSPVFGFNSNNAERLFKPIDSYNLSQ